MTKMNTSHIPTPDEMDAARKACGPTAPLNVLMGWVLSQRRAVQTEQIRQEWTHEK